MLCKFDKLDVIRLILMIDILISMWYSIYIRKKKSSNKKGILKMQTTAIKKKRYVLSPEDIRALRVVYSLLGDFLEDEELTGEIRLEACASVGDAQNIVFTILNLNGIEFDLD